jgi:hypothetical protein
MTGDLEVIRYQLVDFLQYCKSWKKQTFRLCSKQSQGQGNGQKIGILFFCLEWAVLLARERERRWATAAAHGLSLTLSLTLSLLSSLTPLNPSTKTLTTINTLSTLPLAVPGTLLLLSPLSLLHIPFLKLPSLFISNPLVRIQTTPPLFLLGLKQLLQHMMAIIPILWLLQHTKVPRMQRHLETFLVL